MKEEEEKLRKKYNDILEILNQIEKKVKESVNYAVKIAGIDETEIKDRIAKELLKDEEIRYEKLEEMLISISRKLQEIKEEKEELALQLAKELFKKL